MMMHLRSRRIWWTFAILPVALLVLACGMTDSAQVATSARWACPSPLPKPYGPGGPIKAYRHVCGAPDPVTGAQHCHDEPVYFEEWEQEYGNLGGPPFPAPTPYGFNGRSFVFGQRVEVLPFHVTVTADAGSLINRPGITPNTQQLYKVHITWVNAGPDAPFDYSTQVLLRGITGASGGTVTDSNWGMTVVAREANGTATMPRSIPSGASSVTVPIIGPPGTPKIAELRFPGMTAALTSTVTAALNGTVAPVGQTNPDLRAAADNVLAVQWVNSGFDYYGAPPCDDPGALTQWGDGPKPFTPAQAPSGAGRLVQLALDQVGKPYVWGSKGPNTFDCSGLASWTYAQIGIHIPAGTAGQWPGMKPVTQADMQPGDLVYFAIEGGGIDHVGMLAGDLNGDGKWDMVHAANPQLGVRIDYNIFGSSYYASRIRGFRTAR